MSSFSSPNVAPIASPLASQSNAEAVAPMPDPVRLLKRGKSQQTLSIEMVLKTELKLLIELADDEFPPKKVAELQERWKQHDKQFNGKFSKPMRLRAMLLFNKLPFPLEPK